MTDLTGKLISGTYKQLLLINSSTTNEGVGTSTVNVQTGDGTNTALKVATNKVIAQTAFLVDGSATITNGLQVGDKVCASAYFGDGSNLTGLTADVGGDICVNSITVAGGANVGGSLVVKGDTSVSGDLNIGTNASIGGTLAQTGVATFATHVTIAGNAIIEGDVSVSGQLDVNENVSVGGTLGVTGAATFTSKSTFSNDVSVSGRIDTASSLSVGSVLNVTGVANFATNVSISGNANVVGNVTAAFYYGDGSNLINVNAEIGTADNISVSGYINAGGNVSIGGTLVVNDAVSISANAVINGTLTVAGAVSLASTLSVGSNATFLADSTFKTNVSVSGNTNLGGTVTVGGAVSLASTLSVGGVANFADTVTIAGAVSLASTLSVGGAVNLASTATVVGAATFKSNVSVSGNLDVAGNVSVGGTVFATGGITFDGDISVSGDLNVGGTLTVAGAVSLASTLSVGGAVNLASTATVVGAATFKNNVSVSGTFAVGGNTTLGNAAGDLTQNKGGFAAQGTGLPADGAGVEVNFGVVSGEGTVQAFDRDGSAWEQLRLRGSEVSFDISGTEKMQLNTSGNLVMANAAGPALVDEAATATNPTLIPNKADLDTGVAWDSADNLALAAGGTQIATINSSGFTVDSGVFLAPNGSTASPAYTFSNDTNNGLTYINADNWGIIAGGSYNIYIQTAQTFTNKDLFGLDAAGPGFLQEAATATNPTLVPNRADLDTGIGWASANNLSLITGGSEQVRVDSNGDVTLKTGSLVFETASEGVYLGVTSATAANLLDDYEEGDWTPTIGTGATASSDATYNGSFTAGKYTKVGRIVHCSATLRLTDKGTQSGAISILGLPFTSANNVGSRATWSCWFHGASDVDLTGNVTGTIMLYQAGNTAYILVRVKDPSNTSAENVEFADISDTMYLQISGSYIAA